MGTINSSAIVMWEVLSIFFESYCQVHALQLLNEALKLKTIFFSADAGCVNNIAKQVNHEVKN